MLSATISSNMTDRLKINESDSEQHHNLLQPYKFSGHMVDLFKTQSNPTYFSVNAIDLDQDMPERKQTQSQIYNTAF